MSHYGREPGDAGQSWKVLLALFLVGLVLHLLLLGSKSLWLDEVFGMQVAQQGQAALWAGTSDLYHPPLFLGLLEWWMRVAQGEFWLRLPAALAGSVAVPLAYILGSDLFGRRAGLTRRRS